MCWNQDISINTFIFACLSLLFIFFTNTFTKYKTPTFDNPFVYLFLLSVAAMQLIEYFLWRNLKNETINKTLSQSAAGFIILQQIVLMLMIPNLTIRYTMLLFYTFFTIIYYGYKRIYSPIHYHTSIGKNGHLSWEWMNYKGYENIWIFLWLLFYILPLLLIDNFLLSFFILSWLVISLIFYFKYQTFGTMWCWGTNIFLLYFIINILLIQPYYEYNSLC
jgi:hypothetical protein